MTRPTVVALAATTMVLSVDVIAQDNVRPSTALPAFEVATVRHSDNNSPATSIQRLPGGRLVTSNTSLAMLIGWAFGIDDGRLFGALAGADTARFDIVAKAPTDNPAPGQMQLMMRALLAERFKLAVHAESREQTAYSLVRDSGALRIRPLPTTERPASDPFRMSAPGSLAGIRVTTAMLANVLSSQLGRPVRDGTGVEGSFDIVLQWRPDDAPLTDDRPSLFTAIREQLGLRLEATQAAVDVVVVDSLQLTPTDN